MPSASRHYSMPAKDGRRTIVTSEHSRLFTFGVLKPDLRRRRMSDTAPASELFFFMTMAQALAPELLIL